MSEPPDLPRPDAAFQRYDPPDEPERERPLDESHPASLAAATFYTLDDRLDPNLDEPPWDPAEGG